MPRPVCTPPVPWPHRPHALPPRVRTGARRPFFGSRPRTRLCAFPPHLSKNPRHGLRAQTATPAGRALQCVASQCVASQCVASQINSLSRQKHFGRNKSRLSRLMRKSRRSADRFHRNAVPSPPNRFLVRASAPPPKRPRRPRRQRTTLPIRRESRMQSLRKTTFGRQSAAVFCSASFVKALHRHQRSQAGTARQKNGGKASSAPDTP